VRTQWETCILWHMHPAWYRPHWNGAQPNADIVRHIFAWSSSQTSLHFEFPPWIPSVLGITFRYTFLGCWTNRSFWRPKQSKRWIFLAWGTVPDRPEYGPSRASDYIKFSGATSWVLYSYFNPWTEPSVLTRVTEWTMTLLYASRRTWDLARDTGRQLLV
jgi:hypothetical protein